MNEGVWVRNYPSMTVSIPTMLFQQKWQQLKQCSSARVLECVPFCEPNSSERKDMVCGRPSDIIPRVTKICSSFT
ncbi:unnamed protein product [Prunus armeniaca]|uniref:Uncharacterized protein n=1 Tax=Prunus armeniaca TaxID=36596 RepID=A0A6J5V6B9_PRUAR|nr:unnamed protein product [Prunus armeniaca]